MYNIGLTILENQEGHHNNISNIIEGSDVKGFIGVAERLVDKCGSIYQCIWVETAIVKPYNSDTFYCIDCFFHNYSKSDKPESRLLLSYNSKTSPGEIMPGTGKSFRTVNADRDTCSKKGVEEYLLNLYESARHSMKELISEREKSQKKISFRGMLLGLILPRQRDELQEEGSYWGSLTRYKIVMELLKLLGFENGVLRAEVDSMYILYGFDKKGRVSALIGSNVIELPNYNKLLDTEKVLSILFH